MTTIKEKTCEERVAAALRSRCDDLQKLWTAYAEGDEDRHGDDLGNIFEYGLAFDYVAPGTFTDQEHGYFRYQISWGGPSEEIRFYADTDLIPYKIQFWFLDWGDGAFRYPTGEDEILFKNLFDWFRDTGTAQAEYDKATED